MGGIWECAEETIYSKGMNLFAGTQIKLFGIEKKVISVDRMKIRNKYIQGLRNRNPYFSQEPCYASTAFKEYVFILEDNSYVYFDMATEQKDLEFTHIACLNDEFRKFQRSSEPRVIISSNLKTTFGKYICSPYCGFKIKVVNLSDIDGDKIIEDICRRMDKGYASKGRTSLYSFLSHT
jgi:hypothetical protein